MGYDAKKLIQLKQVETKNSVLKQVVTALIISLASGSLGYGFAASTIGSDVRILYVKVDNLNNRVDKIADVLAKIMDQNILLTTIIRVQQQMKDSNSK